MTNEQVIICVDDERSILEGLRSQLSREFGESFIIETAQNGMEALELIDEYLEGNISIPVLISDQLMPGIKGHELLIQMVEKSPGTFNILLTGQSDTEAITEAVNKGNLYRYIAKPWDGTDLILTIKEALKGFEKDAKLEEQNKMLRAYNDQLEQKVEERTKELQQKNREILDSINYAKRIQSAILPPDSVIKKVIPDSFVLYKPKDIVAGDFYWVQEVGDKVLVAAADCTGHGVPGAMVSVICNNGLNRAVRYHNKEVPGEILDLTREIVIEEFIKSEENVQDGMDIALISLDENKLAFAGAHNSLYLIKNGTEEIIEVKGNKQPVGKSHNPRDFNTHYFDIKEGDIIYLFSDGYADQFGGARGKKYKTKNLKNFILSIKSLPMQEQRKALDNEFNNWKGSLEQIDDVCVIGIRV